MIPINANYCQVASHGTMNIDSSDCMCALNETKQEKTSYMDETHLMAWQP